jgi:hypothetical protein
VVSGDGDIERLGVMSDVNNLMEDTHRLLLPPIVSCPTNICRGQSKLLVVVFQYLRQSTRQQIIDELMYWSASSVSSSTSADREVFRASR